MSKIKLIGFDVDGVLLNSFPRVQELDRRIIEKYSGKKPTQEEYKSKFQSTINWDKFYFEFGIPKDKTEEAVAEYYANCPIFPPIAKRALATLDNLTKDYKIDTFICSRAKDNAQQMRNLEHVGLLKYFSKDAIFIGEENKTNNIIKAYSQRNINPKSTAFIGDSPSDIVDAKKANVQSIAMIGDTSYSSASRLKNENPDHFIFNLEDIYTFI